MRPIPCFCSAKVMSAAPLGGLTIGQIRRGVAQAATLGYWMGAPYAGRGYMSKAVRAGIGFAFATLRLHRIEAPCLCRRTRHRSGCSKAQASAAKVSARAYLRINGTWQDHVLYGLLESDPLPLRARKPNATSRA